MCHVCESNDDPRRYVGHPPDAPCRSVPYRLDPPHLRAARDTAATTPEVEPAYPRYSYQPAIEPTDTTRIVHTVHDHHLGAAILFSESETEARRAAADLNRQRARREPWRADVHGAPDIQENGYRVVGGSGAVDSWHRWFTDAQKRADELNDQAEAQADREAAFEMALHDVFPRVVVEEEYSTAGPDTPKGQDELTPLGALGEPPADPPVELPSDLGKEDRRLVLGELLELEADRLQQTGELSLVSAWYLAHLMREAGKVARLTGASTIDQLLERAEALG